MPVARRGVPQRSRRQTSTKERENPLAINADIVTIEIEEMAQFSESTHICLFGPSGVGKTVLAGGAPRATFLTTEKGLTSAQRSGSQARIMRAYDWEHILAGMNKADEVLGEKDWLIVDSGTKMQVLYMRWILRMQSAANSSRSLDIPALQDHQQYQNGFKRFCDHLIDAPYNTIFVFGEMEIPGEDDEMERVPHIEGGKTYQVCRYIIGQFDVGLHKVHGGRHEVPWSDGSRSDILIRSGLPPRIRHDVASRGRFRWNIHRRLLVRRRNRPG